MKKKIAIYGAGSLGTILGAYLAKAGLDVVLINHNKAHVDELRKNGARIIGTVNFSVPVQACTPQEMSEGYDVVFLMTKQLDNARVVATIKPFLSPEGIICTMQNGLPELSVSEVVGEDRTLGCAVGWGATLHGPGVSELTSEPDRLVFSLGCMDGRTDDSAIRDVKAILENMGPVEVDANFMGARWSKLLVNAAFSGMSAVTGLTFGGVADDKKARACAQNLMKETIDVAHAQGVKIEPIQGTDVVKIFNYRGWFKKKISFLLFPLAIKKHRSLKASMLQDLEKGKKCEVDAINGVVCAYGRKASVPTPYNDTVVSLLHAIEDGSAKIGLQNLSKFPSHN
ncbi:ketopantoate reductase family protein [Parasphaerochaeta coccoides]|uniref:2-dehydropantoate 2-reductase n=1 Tax=Parasphaerochaeta coccoides (strain ATCC BAA-1237 / DSM 17374 / SPN1) TaxID=760011 RepID=F4GKB0_PARC1|nr:2-dehydropantoate 2-reductase [Parasphaerochaeta coccoides]AEC02306.1 2-dehydropantoate 2-reductase [Parasphaerochaeta coccoides DSM 17374]